MGIIKRSGGNGKKELSAKDTRQNIQSALGLLALSNIL
jgi:hypothetical protein